VAGARRRAAVGGLTLKHTHDYTTHARAAGCPCSRVAAWGMMDVARALLQESEDDEIVRKTTLREVKVLRSLKQDNIVNLKVPALSLTRTSHCIAASTCAPPCNQRGPALRRKATRRKP